MKNLKRVLSLALTGVMLVGMMAIGASAANKDFTDADEITHTEAVSVMSTLGVLKGKDTGAFDPTATVTRAEMAKIICVMRNGGNDPTLGSASASMFSDTANHWARSYIEYCANLGIIAGQGDGTFAPDAPVTGGAAAKMLLVALGYDSEVFGFTGPDWELNVNLQANDAKLYDEIKNIDTSAGLSRDNTAQMAYNALDAFVMDRTFDKVASSGEITYNYVKSEDETFLNKYFDALVFIGTFEGNSDTKATSVEGQIKVNGRLDTTSATYDDDGKITNNRDARFPSDLDISNIGEEVKVIFKDGKSGTTNVPDKNDTIYGVFNTGKTEVIKVTRNDLDDADKSTEKLEIDGTKYDIAPGGVKVVFNYNDDDNNNIPASAKNAQAVYTKLDAEKADTIKFVCDDDGKVMAAYVVEYKIAKVSSVTSSKVTISGVGAIDIEDNDIYDGIAKDDVVVYTKFYDTDKDDALFTVAKAETVEGELTGYKNTNKLTVAGTTYTVHDKLVEVTDDAKTSVGDDDIGEDVTLYMVGGMVGAVEIPDTTTSSYALVTGSNGGKVDAAYDALNVKVLTEGSTSVKYDVHKDSTYDGETKIKGTSGVDGVVFKDNKDTLIKYSMSGSEIKIKDIVGQTGADGQKVTINATADSTIKLWNKTTKSLNLGKNGSAVAASDAVFFVYVGGTVDKYYTYNLRNLGDITVAKETTLQYYLKDGQVIAAYAELARKPGSNTADTLYGMVTNYDGTVKRDGDTYSHYRIWTGDTTHVYVDGRLTVGDIVTFDQTSDDQYVSDDFTVLSDYDDSAKTYTPNATLVSGKEVLAVAVDSYSGNKGILTYFTATEGVKGDNNVTIYKGSDKALSVTVADDVVIVYVDGDGQKAGSDNDVDEFSSATGYANALLHFDTDGVVDAIVVETSDKISLDSTFPGKGGSTTTHTHTYSALLGAEAATCAKDGNKGWYTCTDKDCTEPAGTKFADTKGTKVTDESTLVISKDTVDHTVSSWTACTDSSDTAHNGTHHSGTCSVCSQTIYEAHDFGDSPTSGTTTCTATGCAATAP